MSCKIHMRNVYIVVSVLLTLYAKSEAGLLCEACRDTLCLKGCKWFGKYLEKYFSWEKGECEKYCDEKCRRYACSEAEAGKSKTKQSNSTTKNPASGVADKKEGKDTKKKNQG